LDTCAVGSAAPPLSGIAPGNGKEKIILAYSLWSPYIYIQEDKPNGFAIDFIGLMQTFKTPACKKLDVNLVQDGWERMWSDSGMPGGDGTGAMIGDAIGHGLYHGGITYTHLKGVRDRMAGFSHAITVPTSQPAGIVVKLKNGKPVVSPKSNLDGVTIVDIAGDAPTPDNFYSVKNYCNGGEYFSANVNFIIPKTNKLVAAMKEFKSNPDAQVMWLYGDQASNCLGTGFTGECEGWDGFGTEWAYLHTGMETNKNGTTIAIGKKYSGLYDIINPCIQDVLASKEYKDLCYKPLRPPLQMETNAANCIPNSFWTKKELDALKVEIYHEKHHERTDSKTCATGYCTCDE
jgi:hypothetical protein